MLRRDVVIPTKMESRRLSMDPHFREDDAMGVQGPNS